MEQTLTSRWGLEPVVVAEEPEPSKDDIDHDGDEITGKTLWDCSKVLHDLVADPDTGNEFSVRGKVRDVTHGISLGYHYQLLKVDVTLVLMSFVIVS